MYIVSMIECCRLSNVSRNSDDSGDGDGDDEGDDLLCVNVYICMFIV